MATWKLVVSIPLPESEYEMVIGRRLLLVYVAVGGVVIAIVGAVLSRFTVTVAVLDLPAWSVTVPEICSPVPSVVTETGVGQLTMADTLGAQVKVTVALELFHPAALGAGDTEAVIPGAVFSRLMVVLALALFPALSVTDALNCWPLPSVLTTCCGGQTVTPDRVSAQV